MIIILPLGTTFRVVSDIQLAESHLRSMPTIFKWKIVKTVSKSHCSPKIFSQRLQTPVLLKLIFLYCGQPVFFQQICLSRGAESFSDIVFPSLPPLLHRAACPGANLPCFFALLLGLAQTDFHVQYAYLCLNSPWGTYFSSIHLALHS